MAIQPNPEVLVFGVVKAINERTKFGTEEPNGREVVILANSGFLTVRIPVAQKFQIELESDVLWTVDFNQWMISDKATGEVKTGTTLTFKNALRAADLAGFEAALALSAA